MRERRGRFETFVAEIVERLTTCLQGALVAVLEENILDLFSNRRKLFLLVTQRVAFEFDKAHCLDEWRDDLRLSLVLHEELGQQITDFDRDFFVGGFDRLSLLGGLSRRRLGVWLGDVLAHPVTHGENHNVGHHRRVFHLHVFGQDLRDELMLRQNIVRASQTFNDLAVSTGFVTEIG